MDVSYEDAGYVLRAGVELMEGSAQEEFYTKDLEAFVDHVFEPVMYDSLPIEKPGGSDGPSDHLVEEEFEYWADRFGRHRKEIRGNLERHIEDIQESLINYSNNKEINTVIAPAVSGIPIGIIARDILEPENFGIVGYRHVHRSNYREVAFNTIEECKGDLLVADDAIGSGASMRGVRDDLESQDKNEFAIDATGDTYEVVENPVRWKVKNYYTEKPKMLLVPEEGELNKENPDFNPINGDKIAAYTITGAATGYGIWGLMNGELDPVTYVYSASLGSLGIASEFFLDAISESR